MAHDKTADSSSSAPNAQAAHDRVKELKQLLAHLLAGSPALTAIGQTQRLIRTRRDHGQIGLCEFHIGLIYRYYGDPRSAAAQFAGVHQSWTLAGDAPRGC